MNINDKSFFYEDTVSVIAESILGLMSHSVKSFETHERWDYNIPIADDLEGMLYFNWRMAVHRVEGLKAKYDLQGYAGRDCFDEPSIDINIILPKGVHQKKVKIDRCDLFEVVAHEIHHLAQNIENNAFSRNRALSARMSYFLDPCEIEAFHIGVRASSSVSGRSFEETARKYLNAVYPAASNEELNLIVHTWKNTKFELFQSNLSRNDVNY
tara:strand:+ start:609 stop:1244 length:636 start_codon:yes stop_codon:yes gene_type:complete